MSVFVHPTAVVDPGAELGDGTRVWHFSHVMARARLGRKCVVGQNVYLGNVTVGDGVKIQNNVSLYDGVTLEDEVFCGPSCVFTNVINPRAFIERKDEYRPTRVRRGATIGANATILCGATVGEYALVGAGAVVHGDVPSYALVVGVPARRIGWACRCGVTLPATLACGACGAGYVASGETITPA
jgi:UDP-2-acetamido-3-amino-2,3-dideoxy-glucuronate N-acetyltransferase